MRRHSEIHEAPLPWPPVDLVAVRREKAKHSDIINKKQKYRTVIPSHAVWRKRNRPSWTFWRPTLAHINCMQRNLQWIGPQKGRKKISATCGSNRIQRFRSNPTWFNLPTVKVWLVWLFPIRCRVGFAARCVICRQKTGWKETVHSDDSGSK